MAGSGSPTKVVLTAVFGNSVVTVSKFFAWVFTGSASMLAEAIHSLADTANQILLYIGIKHGETGPTRFFPWGKGQAQYVWNLVSAVGIFFVGFGVTTYHGVSTLLHPHEETGTPWISMGVLGFAFLVEGYAFFVAFKEINKQRGDIPFFKFLKLSDDPTTVGVLLEDFIAVLGILVAFVCVGLSMMAGTTTADSIGSIVIGVLLGVMAIFLAIINGRLLIGTAVSPTLEDEIEKFVSGFPEVEKIENLKTVVLGSGKVHLAMEVELHGEMMIDRSQISKDAEKIQSGEAPVPILVDTASRMVRVVGMTINQLEINIQRRFPNVTMIEFEIH